MCDTCHAEKQGADVRGPMEASSPSQHDMRGTPSCIRTRPHGDRICGNIWREDLSLHCMVEKSPLGEP